MFEDVAEHPVKPMWWGGRGLNPGPRDYESPALTG